jgi:hypothetical protein
MIPDPKFEVAEAVVGPFAILVMNLLPPEQRPAECPLHYQAVLCENPIASRSGIVPPATGGLRNPPVPLGIAQWVDPAPPGRWVAWIFPLAADRTPWFGCLS